MRDGDFIIVPTGVGEPPTLLTALSEQRRDFHDMKVAQILAMRKYAYMRPSEPPPTMSASVASFTVASPRPLAWAAWQRSQAAVVQVNPNVPFASETAMCTSA